MMEGGEWEFSNSNSVKSRSRVSLYNDTDSKKKQIVNLGRKSHNTKRDSVKSQNKKRDSSKKD